MNKKIILSLLLAISTIAKPMCEKKIKECLSNPLATAISKNDIIEVKELIEKKEENYCPRCYKKDCTLCNDIEECECSGNCNKLTPFNQAIANGHINIVRYLIEEQDIDIEEEYHFEIITEPNSNTGTALEMAIYHGHYDIVVYLLEQGAILTEQMKLQARERIFTFKQKLEKLLLKTLKLDDTRIDRIKKGIYLYAIERAKEKIKNSEKIYQKIFSQINQKRNIEENLEFAQSGSNVEVNTSNTRLALFTSFLQ